MRNGKAHAPESVVIIDDNKLRQAAFTCLLGPWADEHGVEIVSICLADMSSVLEQCPAPRLILLSLGGDKASDPLCQRNLGIIATAMPGTPVVVISDHEDGEDVVAAFNGGAQGFLATSLAPEIALQALSFIVKGGSFFPRSTLRYLSDKLTPLSGCLACADEMQDEREKVTSHSFSAQHSRQTSKLENVMEPLLIGSEKLTERQQSVLTLLRTGLSNKMIARELGMTEATVKVHVRHVMRKLGVSNRTEAAIIATSLHLDTTGCAPMPKTEGSLPGAPNSGGSHRISVRLYSRLHQNGKDPRAHADWDAQRSPVSAKPSHCLPQLSEFEKAP